MGVTAVQQEQRLSLLFDRDGLIWLEKFEPDPEEALNNSCSNTEAAVTISSSCKRYDLKNEDVLVSAPFWMF